MSKFTLDILENVCELIVDCPHSTPKWSDNGIIVIRNQNIIDDVLNLSNPSYTDEESYIERTKRAIPQKDDIVITREAPMGRVCLIPENLRCCLGQRQVLLRVNTNIVDSKYLYWALKSPFVQNQIMLNEGTGATVSNMRIPVLKALKIPRFNKETEGRIVDILSTISQKIQLNTQTNQTLEAIAQAIFKSWFVDFDPVRAKAQAILDGKTRDEANLSAMAVISGKTIEDLSQTEYQELWEIAEAFPSELVENEQFGEVPKGWEIVGLSSLFEFIGGSQPPKSEHIYNEQEGYERFIQNRDYSNENHITYIPISKKNKRCNEKDILMDKYGEAGKVRFGIKGAYNVALAKIQPKAENLREFLRGYFMQDSVMTYLHMSSIASTRNSLNSSSFAGLNIVIPNDMILDRFEEVVSTHIDAILKLKTQNKMLAKTRDLLLPRLLSGELLNE